MSTASTNPTTQRENELIAMLGTVSRQLADSGRHAVRVLRGEFTGIAILHAKGEYREASDTIERVYNSNALKSIASSVNVTKDELTGLIADLRRKGGPIAEIVLGLTLVAGGAAILVGASTASIVGALVAAAYMIVGILIALVGVGDLAATRMPAG